MKQIEISFICCVFRCLLIPWSDIEFYTPIKTTTCTLRSVTGDKKIWIQKFEFIVPGPDAKMVVMRGVIMLRVKFKISKLIFIFIFWFFFLLTEAEWADNQLRHLWHGLNNRLDSLSGLVRECLFSFWNLQNVDFG